MTTLPSAATETVFLSFAEEDEVMCVDRAGDREPPDADHLARCGVELPVDLVERLVAARAVWVAAQNDVLAHLGRPIIEDGWFG